MCAFLLDKVPRPCLPIYCFTERQRDSDEDSDDSTEPSAAKRQSHNVAEKRRRDKINIKLAELRSLLPNAKASQSKATTLHAAVELLDSLEHEHTRLWELNQSLTTENRYLQGLAKATAAEIPVTPISPVIKHENGLKPSIDAPRGMSHYIGSLELLTC